MEEIDKHMGDKKRRLGDRKDGRKIRTLDPMNRLSPYIMKTRVGSSNFIMGSLEITEIEKYIQNKRNEGLKGFGLLHVFLAAYVRGVSQLPGINRFIAGQRAYARNNIEIALVIKKEMKLDATETCVKIECEPTDTIYDVFAKMNDIIEKNRAVEEKSEFDNIAKILDYIPGLFLRFVVSILNCLDYFGLLPRFLTKISPFHCSFFITSMGSLGIPPIFHHLYDFGTVPIFLSYGKKRKAYELDKKGNVVEKKYIDYTVTSDERICDGHYFSVAMKFLNECFKNPEILDTPPLTVAEDIK